MMARVLRAVLLGMTALSAACTPSSFQDLTGGAAVDTSPVDDSLNPHSGGEVRIDPTLEAPRHLSPPSVTWVNTLRPRFRWALGAGSIGAVVELSRTRDFKGEVRRFVATGAELDTPADLERGIWFWRLRARNDGVEGAADDKAIVWEVLVRGPSAPGKDSFAPVGGVVDQNGDGIPDLAMTYEAIGEEPGDPDVAGGVTFLGHPGGTFTIDESSGAGFITDTADIPVAGGIDVDGDGFTDLATAELLTEPGKTQALGHLFFWYGGPQGLDVEKDQRLGWVNAPVFTEALPALQLAGDINGDGYGDLSVLLPGLGFSTFGSKHGGASLQIFASDEDPNVLGPALAGNCDLDGDGLSDVVIASTVASSPIRYTRGAPDRLDPLVNVALGPIGTPSRATALTTGDFDGSGASSVAFATVIDGAPHVCIYGVDKGPVTECWKGSGTADDVAQSLGAGDIDGDGTDEIVVGASSGIFVLKWQGTGFVATPIPGSFGGSITVVHPGRGGPGWENAMWAVHGADQKSIHVFRGTDLKQKIEIAGHAFLKKLGPAIR